MRDCRIVKKIVNQAMLGLLALLGMVPVPLMRHLCFLLRRNPRLTDRWGVHIRPIHFYEPLPDFSRITVEQTNRRRVSETVDFNLPGQVQLVRRLGERYRVELEGLAQRAAPDGFDFGNGYFGNVDAALYYAILRDLKPARVIEIGSGYSTRIADLALRRNRTEGRPGRLTCIEPFPQPRLTDVKLEMKLIERPVEEVRLDIFRSLNPGDVLFIDSSHAVKYGGDVCREFLEILPSLKAGVWVHVHDIFFPHDYPAEWVREKRIAWSEQYLLEAFLAYNQAFSVQAANYWLCKEFPAVVAELWPDVQKDDGSHGGASFWMRKEA